MTEIDPQEEYVMYIIPNLSLKMGVGKTVAQCGHGIAMIACAYAEEIEFLDYDYRWKPKHDNFRKWAKDHFVKVTLEANPDQWEQLKEQIKDGSGVLVVDEGRTEVAPNSETAIVFWPMKRKDRSPLLCSLRPLK